MIALLDGPDLRPAMELPGLEADSLLAFLALMGLLRALETARPNWKPRASWQGPPWVALLHLSEDADKAAVAGAANEGILTIAREFNVDGRHNVDFDRDDYRAYVERTRAHPTGAALAAALTSEWPEKKAGGLAASPLVMMFGQGHQNFLDRLLDVPRGELPSRLKKLKSPPDMRDATKIAEALFLPWKREDDAHGFRWDPEEDQRYALRFDDPSAAGAALTVVGANRLAAIGFLSFPSAPGVRRMTTVGVSHEKGEWAFLWPIWSPPLSRLAIEALLSHPDLIRCAPNKLRSYGVLEIFRAYRISNGKYMNMTRARPVQS
jgi:hypothetical protein